MGGEEIFVFEGMFEDEYGCYLKGIWICSFYGLEYMFFFEEGVLIYVKMGYFKWCFVFNSVER